MGVVQKAIDTRLNRPVAIKTIPEGVGLDTNAVLRLRAEAQAAASLDHPYICKIYELLDADEGTHIVMEFVEGETLAAMLLQKSPLPHAEVLRYGMEIAEGLAAAHAKGLVHRDVKPSNVMVTPHGHVKLLDFGIARSWQLGSGITTTQSAVTRPGSVSGSPLYMAPEQALGREVGGKTDVFSLGVVLFECITGTLPFEGATRDAYVLEMLTGRRRSLGELAPTLPKPVVEVIESCLEREPEVRPDAATLAAFLRSQVAPGGTTERFVFHRRRSLKRQLMTAGAFIVLGAGAAWGLYRWLVPPEPPPIGKQEALITWASDEHDPRLSPDQKWVSFISNRDGVDRLFIVAAAGGDARPLTDPSETVIGQVWSPDGSKIAALVRIASRWSVRVLEAPFGQQLPTTVFFRDKDTATAFSDNSRLLRWVGDWLYLAMMPGQQLYRRSLVTNDLEEISKDWQLPGKLHWFDVSPDGRRVVLALTAPDSQEDLWVADIDGRRQRRLTNDSWIERSPVWSRGGTTVVFQSNRSGQLDLWEIEVAGGRSWALTSSPTEERFGEGSADGGLQTFQQVTQNASLYLVRPGSDESVQITADALSDFAPVAGGGRVAFQRSRPSMPFGHRFFDSSVLVGPLEPGRLTTETQLIEEGFAPSVSPDGSRLAYFQRPAARSHFVLRVRNLLTGQTTTASDRAPIMSFGVFPLDWIEQNVAWSRKTDEVFFVASDDQAYSLGSYRPSAEVGQRVQVLATSGPKELIRDLHVSPDGNRLAYLRYDTAKKAFELRVRDLASGAETVFASEPSGRAGVVCRGWAREGKSIVLVIRTVGDPPGARVREVRGPGQGSDVATIEGAFATTARLDEARSLVYLTRVQRSVHNIVRVSLLTGDVRDVTTNQLPSVSFGGVQPLESGGFMYSRDERKADIWIVRSPGYQE